jgi:hypothetical protein
MLNADRFLALYFGVQYYTRVTKKKILVLVLLMPVISAVITYLTFFNVDDALGVSCDSLITWKNNMVSLTGRMCVILIVISNVFFYLSLVIMLKSKDQLKIIGKISVITGSVLLMCAPALVVFIFLPNSEDRKLYFYAVLPVLVKSILNPFIYVWRFADSRYQLKMALYFWNKRILDEIETARKNYYSSYQITSENVNHSNKQMFLTRQFCNKVDCEPPQNSIELGHIS